MKVSFSIQTAYRTLEVAYNPSIHFLGLPCKYGHQTNQGLNIRCNCNRGCLACLLILRDNAQLSRHEKKVKAEAEKNKVTSAHPFDMSRYLLGNLCKRGHRYFDSEFTLRRIKGYICIKCNHDLVIKHQKTPRAASLRKARKQSDAYRAKNREYKKSARGREADRRWRQTEKCKEYQAIYQRMRKAMVKNAQIIPYDREQLKDHFAIFNNRCAYCGKDGKLSTDHVTPIVKGGIDALCNIVPACPQCNSSKCANDLLSWFKKQSFFSEDRIELILNHLQKASTDLALS